MLHYAAWSFFGMHILWWVFWFALISLTFVTVTPVPKSQLRSGELALDILRRRYAAGQFSTEEYERRKAVIERDESPRVSTAVPRHQH